MSGQVQHSSWAVASVYLYPCICSVKECDNSYAADDHVNIQEYMRTEEVILALKTFKEQLFYSAANHEIAG